MEDRRSAHERDSPADYGEARTEGRDRPTLRVRRYDGGPELPWRLADRLSGASGMGALQLGLGISTIDNFDLALVPVGELVREALVPYYITAADDGALTLTDAGMAELTRNWSAKADTSFANVSVGGTLVVLGDATFA